ncbi:ADP-ribosylglycohydrolase family protein [Pelagibacterium mangrovi]|uniref:ADP-ribosylglycohydrolase family protein n=1 Tax=Pelagibacterium mangrovi TaxID=3119828 RepID=UPI002FC88643
MAATTYSKIFGSIAGSRIGSSMSMPTEHLPIEESERRYGFLDEMRGITQNAKEFRWPHGPLTLKKQYEFPAGSTEDGIERQKLIADAIIQKNDRINIHDLAQSWLRNIRDEHFGYSLHYSDKPYYEMLKAGMHPSHIGLFSLWPQIVTFARSCHPIGLVNAGDPAQAIDDVYQIGSIYHQQHGTGLQVAAAYAGALAEAMRPSASVESALRVALDHLDRFVRADFEAVFSIAEQAEDIKDARRKINDFFIYRYGELKSSGEEVVSRGMAITILTRGDARESILHGVNFARDTDCTTAIAAGLSGALSGMDGIPADWIETLDRATKANTAISVCSRSLEETAKGIYSALANNHAKRSEIIREIAAH